MNKPIFEAVAKLFDTKFIKIDDSTITFTIQDGPIKEVGINGCQIDQIGEVWLEILNAFDQLHPSYENTQAIIKIQEALLWQLQRTRDRTKRQVEGTNRQ